MHHDVISRKRNTLLLYNHSQSRHVLWIVAEYLVELLDVLAVVVNRLLTNGLAKCNSNLAISISPV
jgi:hypothetical protein